MVTYSRVGSLAGRHVVVLFERLVVHCWVFDVSVTWVEGKVSCNSRSFEGRVGGVMRSWSSELLKEWRVLSCNLFFVS